MNIGAERNTRFNVVEIVGLKAWLRRVGFPSSALVLVRENERNVVFLRIRLDDAVADIEAAWLDTIRRERGARESAQLRIMERLTLSQAVAVA